MKRGTSHIWELKKYTGDIAIYAVCRCGYRYPCTSNKNTPDGSFSLKQEVTRIFPYCPVCGARKTKYTRDIERVDGYVWE